MTPLLFIHFKNGLNCNLLNFASVLEILFQQAILRVFIENDQ